MEYIAFHEAYNWILQSKYDYKRTEDNDNTLPSKVWDCENGNWIDFVEAEKERYKWSKRRNAYELPKGC